MTVKVYPGYIHRYRHYIQILLPSTFQHRTYFIPYISVQYADITIPLKQRAVAEGVETEDELNFLKSIECNYIQGYYFYRPTFAI